MRASTIAIQTGTVGKRKVLLIVMLQIICKNKHIVEKDFEKGGNAVSVHQRRAYEIDLPVGEQTEIHRSLLIKPNGLDNRAGNHSALGSVRGVSVVEINVDKSLL